MRTLAILVLLVAAGCAQRPESPTAEQVAQSCGVGSPPFTQTWPCVRTGLAPLSIEGDLKGLYIATGDFVAEQVQSGKMTDAEAKLAMAEAGRRINSEAIARQNAAAQRDAATDAVVLGTIMNRPNPFATQPAPVMGSPVFISGPRGNSITCQRTGPNSVFCS